MNISVIGHGYVGLVTSAVFADLGNNVWCVGRTEAKINNLKKGIIPFYEPGLEEIVKRNFKAGRLKFTVSYEDAIPQSKVVFICVGTPSKNNGEADLSSVFTAASAIAKNIAHYTVIVIKSTVPVGTNKKIKKLLTADFKISASKFNIASCPEFLREGTALTDTLNPDRIVIGCESEKAKEILLELHKPLNGKRVITDIETAEIIKYAANAILAAKISFANAIAFLCERAGADVEKVMEAVGLDKRIGRAFLYPGVGYGGSCLPKDVKAFIASSQKLGYNFLFLKAVDEINVQAKKFFVQKIINLCNGSVKNKTVGVLGLSFKPDTDDMRQAPSIEIIRYLQKLGAKIKVYDPQAKKKAQQILKNVIYSSNSYETAKDSNCLIIITEWNEFRQLDLEKIKKLMKKPVIVDGRNIYDPKKLKSLGFQYSGVGR